MSDGPGPTTLILVRHAKAARPTVTADHERPLTDTGIMASRSLGHQLAAAGLVPDLALVSTAARTRQTWDEMTGQWHPDLAAGVRLVVARALYDASAADVVQLVRATAEVEATVLVCGHEPAMSAVASQLAVAGSDPDALADIAQGMRTGAAAVLQLDGPPWPGLSRARLVAVLGPDPR